jgi:acid phosphatase
MELHALKKWLKILAAGLVFMFGLRFLGAQPSTLPAFSTDVAAERIPNLDTIKKELRQYHDCTCTCGCYAHDLDVQADRAIAFLRRRAARRTPNGNSGAKEKLALILDIDETALSNYKELVGADFAYNASVFDAWVDTGQAPAIPGSLRLYKEAQRLGVSVFFITGRLESQRDATERNLRAVGFDNWQELAMRPVAHGSETIGAFKALVRGQIVAQGYTLILNVGDQWSDMKGQPEAEFSVKYPDPYYFIP